MNIQDQLLCDKKLGFNQEKIWILEFRRSDYFC